MNLFRRLDRVFQLEGIRPHQRLVLANLAHRADERSLTCYPSAARIAADTGMTRRGVQIVIKTLREQGLISVTSGRAKGRSAPNMYRLDFLEIANPVRHSDGDKRRTAEQGMANSTIVNGEPGSHEPLNLKETFVPRPSDGAPALEARAPRRPRTPEPGESPKAKQVRQLFEVAAIHGWHQLDGENDRDYQRRLRRLNDVRVAGLK